MNKQSGGAGRPGHRKQAGPHDRHGKAVQRTPVSRRRRLAAFS